MKTPFRFIVVDDDPFNNMVCKYTILKFNPGADIQLFTHPEKALEAIKGQFSDATEGLHTILFLDINMPVMSGWEFLDVFQSFNDNIHQQFRVYILSSSIDQGDQHQADVHPLVNGYYSKPLSHETISQILMQEPGSGQHPF